MWSTRLLSAAAAHQAQLVTTVLLSADTFLLHQAAVGSAVLAHLVQAVVAVVVVVTVLAQQAQQAQQHKAMQVAQVVA